MMRLIMRILTWNPKICLISIHLAHHDYGALVHSHSVMDGFGNLSGHSAPNFRSPFNPDGSWNVRSEAASAPPDFSVTGMISDSDLMKRAKIVLILFHFVRRDHRRMLTLTIEGRRRLQRL